MAIGVQGDAIPLMGFPKGLKTPLVKGGVKAPPAKLPCPKRRRCEGRAFTHYNLLIRIKRN